MARFVCRTRAEVQKATREIQKRNVKLFKDISGGQTKILFNAIQIVEARAKEILTEKGHIVTGNLRRSINTSVVESTGHRSLVAVGSFVDYAPFVEALPDGGYLFPASEETFATVTKYLVEHGIKPAIKESGR
jgi:hypothetical protein